MTYRDENNNIHKSDLSFDLLAEMMMVATSIQTDSEYCVFIRFSGHVEVIDIEIATNISDYHDKIFKTETYFTNNEQVQETINQLEDFYYKNITMKAGNQ